MTFIKLNKPLELSEQEIQQITSSFVGGGVAYKKTDFGGAGGHASFMGGGRKYKEGPEAIIIRDNTVVTENRGGVAALALLKARKEDVEAYNKINKPENPLTTEHITHIHTLGRSNNQISAFLHRLPEELGDKLRKALNTNFYSLPKSDERTTNRTLVKMYKEQANVDLNGKEGSIEGQDFSGGLGKYTPQKYKPADATARIAVTKQVFQTQELPEDTLTDKTKYEEALAAAKNVSTTQETEGAMTAKALAKKAGRTNAGN